MVRNLWAVAAALAVVCVVVGVEGAQVSMLEGAEVGPAYGAQSDISMHHIRAASDTFAAVKRKVQHRGFNILGFFGCCFHCKHDPTCTEGCMHRHHIQNGFEDTALDAREEQSEEQSEELSQQRLLQTADVVAFIQESAGEARDHKPIALHLNEGSSTYHKAPERPQESADATGAVKKASSTLVSEENDSKHFRTNEFFHCAFSCRHDVSCEEGCLNRHHMGMPHSDLKPEEASLGSDDAEDPDH